MSSALATTLAELDDSRVRVHVEIPSVEVEGVIEREAGRLARSLKLPGFRRGKVPPSMALQRIGREAVLEEALHGALGAWYVDAIEHAGIVPVGDPSIELGAPPARDQPFRFSFEVGVLPKAKLGKYRGLEVGRREPSVTDAQIEEEIAALCERLARLEDVERPLAPGDFAVIDYVGKLEGKPIDGGEGRDQLVEIGAGRLIPGLEAGLLGAGAGESRSLEVTFPEDYTEPTLAGRPANFEVVVKQVKHKELPPVDEDLAADAGFDSLAQLRADVASHLEAADREAVDREFREAVLEAAVAEAKVSVPDELAQARAREVWERTLRTLARQGVSRETYLKIAERSEEEQLADLVPGAAQALRREAVLTAIVEAEDMQPGDAELFAALSAEAGAGAQADGEIASRAGSERDAGATTGEEHARQAQPGSGSADEAQRLIDALRRAGRLEEAREQLAVRNAVDLIVAEARPIPLERAKAREKLWTPNKAADAQEGGRGGPGAGSPGARPGSREGLIGAPGARSDAPATDGPGERLWTPGR
ncbi:MAG: trigger factor [Solirubrobacteraceae bacterium]